MQVRDLGLIEYSQALKIQEEVVDQVLEKGAVEETLLVCEHPAVITVGRASGSDQEILRRDFPIVSVSRGGRSTLHLPGQVVIYPILNLEKRGKDLHAYMRLLESVMIETLADFRVTAVRIPEKTGVWVPHSKLGSGEKKIASIGVAVRKWVTYHGLSLNVACDLKMFAALKPCGFSPSVMTSLIEEMDESYRKTWAVNRNRLMKDVKNRLVENFAEITMETWSES